MCKIVLQSEEKLAAILSASLYSGRMLSTLHDAARSERDSRAEYCHPPTPPSRSFHSATGNNYYGQLPSRCEQSGPAVVGGLPDSHPERGGRVFVGVNGLLAAPSV